MSPFTYARAHDAADAVRSGGEAQAKYLGGGTNLVDLLRETIERPRALVDVTGLSSAIEERADGSLLIGAAARNTAVAEHRAVRTATRCSPAPSSPARRRRSATWRRWAATSCSAPAAPISTTTTARAATSARPARAATRWTASTASTRSWAPRRPAWPPIPSDMCVALAALGAVVHLRGAAANATLPLTDLHRLPGEHPEIETTLEPGELITAVELPALPFAARSTYRKVRDRASYAFALVSVAAALELDGGTVKDVRLALGGVAHKPWRAWKAEAALRGQPATAGEFPRRRRGRTRGRPAAARQRIQDRTGEAHDRRRARRTDWRTNA